MPSITIQNLSVAANSATTNQLSGELYEFISVDSAVRLLAAAAAVGLRATFNVGGVVVMNDSPVSQANRFPIQPDDLLVEVGAMAGERLFLTFRNTTGAAIIVHALVVIEEV